VLANATGPAIRLPVAPFYVGKKCPFGLRTCLPKPPSTPRYRVSLVEYGNGPMVAACAGRPSVRDRTPRAAPRIDYQLGTGAELPPLPGDVRRSSVWTQ
jgi:hypothetical protein